MIAVGIVFIILGGISVFYGNQLNNNMEVKLDEFFSKGTTNPGEGFVIIGIIALIVGGIFLIAGLIRILIKSKNSNTTPVTQKAKQSVKINTLNELKNKGLITQEDYDAEISKLTNIKVYCRNCGTAIDNSSSFCPNCGCKQWGGGVCLKNLKKRRMLIY